MTARLPYTGSLSPEFAMLGLLAIQPDHGYNLHQRLLVELGQIWHISLSQTYNILNRLEAQNYLSGSQFDQEKRPSRRQFQLTQSGLQRFRDWLAAPSADSVRAIRVEFTTRLYFAVRLDPSKAYDLIDGQEKKTRLGLQRLKKSLDELPSEQEFNRLGLDLRIRQLSSILEWLDECRSMLARAQTGQ